jgi:hypothetical protein
VSRTGVQGSDSRSGNRESPSFSRRVGPSSHDSRFVRSQVGRIAPIAPVSRRRRDWGRQAAATDVPIRACSPVVRAPFWRDVLYCDRELGRQIGTSRCKAPSVVVADSVRRRLVSVGGRLLAEVGHGLK